MFWQTAQLGRNPFLNKGNAFSMAERKRFALNGILPSRVLAIDQQVRVVLHSLNQLPTKISKMQNLLVLYMTNRTLFFRCLEVAPTATLPIVDAWADYISTNPLNEVLQMGRDTAFLSVEMQQAEIMQTLKSVTSQRQIKYILISDGAAVDCQQDAGINCELQLLTECVWATVAGGIDPLSVLPMVIDAGTSNPNLLTNDFYLGAQHRRPNRQDYLAKIDQIGLVIHQIFPNALIYVCNQPGTVLADFYREISFANPQLSQSAVANIELFSHFLFKQQFHNRRTLIMTNHADGIQLAKLLSLANQHHGKLDDIWISNGRSQLIQFGSKYQFKSGQPALLRDLCETVRPEVVIGESPNLIATIRPKLPNSTKIISWQSGWHASKGGDWHFGQQHHYLAVALMLALQAKWHNDLTVDLAAALGEQLGRDKEQRFGVGTTVNRQRQQKLHSLLKVLRTDQAAGAGDADWRPIYHDFSL